MHATSNGERRREEREGGRGGRRRNSCAVSRPVTCALFGSSPPLPLPLSCSRCGRHRRCAVRCCRCAAAGALQRAPLLFLVFLFACEVVSVSPPRPLLTLPVQRAIRAGEVEAQEAAHLPSIQRRDSGSRLCVCVCEEAPPPPALCTALCVPHRDRKRRTRTHRQVGRCRCPVPSDASPIECISVAPPGSTCHQSCCP